MDLVVLADHRVKLRESKKKDKYLDPTREFKATMEPELFGAIGTILNGLVKILEDSETRGQTEIIQTTTLRSARILRRVL